MSTGYRRPKTLKVDKDALREVRQNVHKKKDGGLGVWIALIAFVALCICLNKLRESKLPSSDVRRPIETNATAISAPPAEPKPEFDISSVLAEQEESKDQIDVAGEDLSSVSKFPAAGTAAVRYGAQHTRIDHLSPELISPSARKVYLQIGRLDGRPENAASPFDGEFGKDTVSGTVVRMDADRVRTEFPQRIRAGQSIVIKLPEMVTQDLLFRAVSVRRDKPGTMLDPTKEVPSLRILCNGQSIWGRQLSRQEFVINALIPATYLESYKNTITLQNDGKLPVVFDALWIESAREVGASVRFAIRDWDRIPERYRGEFAWSLEREGEQQLPGIPSSRDMLLGYPMQKFKEALTGNEKVAVDCNGLWRYRNMFVAFNEQEKVALYFLEKAVGWYFQGGSALTIENVTGPGRFFCPYSDRLYPSAYALWSLCRVFEGEAKRLPVNIVAGGGDERPLEMVYWMATENKPGVASIIVAKSRFGRTPGGKVRVVCALPWQGATVAKVYNGVFPESINLDKPTYRGVFSGGKRQDDPDGVYDRNREDKVERIQLAPNGKGGLLDAEWNIQDCLYVRLVKQGATEIGSPEKGPPVLSPLEKTVSAKLVGGVTESRENGLLRRKTLPVFPGLMRSLCANYRVSMGKATRSTITEQDYVVPENTQSLFCDIDYTGGTAQTAEGAALRLYSFHENIDGKTLSFWVYPHTKTTSRNVTLRMALGAWEGRATLKSGKWQRVELQFVDLSCEPERYLVLRGPPDYDRPTGAEVIRFEFNGIALLDNEGSAGQYMDARPLKNGGLGIVVLGLPGQEGIARHSFQKAVAVNTVKHAVEDGKKDAVKWAYSGDTQILEMAGFKFPESTSQAVLSHLNYKERERCRQKGLTPVVLIAEVGR